MTGTIPGSDRGAVSRRGHDPPSPTSIVEGPEESPAGKSFKARPVPRSTYESPPGAPDRAVRSSRSAAPTAKRSSEEAAAAESSPEAPKPSKARPVPSTTYTVPPPNLSSPRGRSSTRSASTPTRIPTFKSKLDSAVRALSPGRRSVAIKQPQSSSTTKASPPTKIPGFKSKKATHTAGTKAAATEEKTGKSRGGEKHDQTVNASTGITATEKGNDSPSRVIVKVNREDLEDEPETVDPQLSRGEDGQAEKASHVSKGMQLPSTSSDFMMFILICSFRIINVLFVQSFFDPDEYWQTLEPAYCAVFASGGEEKRCAGLTWEWNRRAPDDAANLFDRSTQGPVRSYLSILPTYLLYLIAKAIDVDTAWVVSRGPMILYSVAVAAPVDYAVWYSARWLQSKAKDTSHDDANSLAGWSLFCSLVSWFNGYSLIRTFTNSQETMLLALAVALTSPELIGDNDAQFGFVRACLAFFAGGLSAAIRFTSLAAFVPMGVLLSARQNSLSSRVGYLLVPCALFGLAGICLAMLVDRYFFGFWTIPVLSSFHFNVFQDMASIYGTHPWHWYMSAGLPAISGVLFPFVLVEFAHKCFSGTTSYGERNLWIIALAYIIGMSFNAHKEFRFIHPVLPLLCLLVSRRVRQVFVGKQQRRPRKAFFVFVFIAVNAAAVLYLGLFHQSGPVLINRKIVDVSLLQSGKPPHFLIYYFTGACHSTPLHSHLHAPPLEFETWSLDCSPGCRADASQLCESDRFVQDPIPFVEEFLCVSTENQAAEKDGNQEKAPETCRAGSNVRPIPDYVVTVSKFAGRIRSHLESAGFREIARYPHHITGATLGGRLFGDYKFSNNRSYSHFTLYHESVLEVSVEDMILFARNEIRSTS